MNLENETLVELKVSISCPPKFFLRKKPFFEKKSAKARSPVEGKGTQINLCSSETFTRVNINKKTPKLEF